jgi:Tissue inhibitor of metalloproteinase
MRSPLRRLLVILIAGLTTVVVTDAPAHACSCKALTVSQRIDGADFVFSGTVTMASGPTTSGKTQVMSYDVKVDRVYKGDITSARTTVKSAADETSCGLTGMTADNRYLFFVRAAGANLKANRCGGTKPATSSLTQKIVALLGAGSTPIPPTPEAATFTPVADAEPPPLTRLAAPGAAALIIGLLGLLVFGRLGRVRH